MKLIKMQNTKAQVSLEYILIVGAVVSLLLVIVTSSSILYKKNLSAIDDRELIRTGENIQQIIDTFELMPTGKEKVIITPEQTWTITYKDYLKKTIILSNGNKEKPIISISDIYLEKKEVSEKSEIIITKIDDKIYIYIEKAN